MARGNGRMCREDGLAGDLTQSVVEPHAVIVHPLANDFQRAKSAVALVEMINARCNAQRSQRLDAADAEDQLLANTCSLVATIQTAGQVAILRAVTIHVAIEQE